MKHMKNLLSIVFCIAVFGLSGAVRSQDLYMTRTGQISFFSKTSMENIDAINNEVTSVLNTKTGELAFAVLIKSFRFEKALMEEHFNENYMESSRFPKSTFSGKILNLSDIDFGKDGTYRASVEGDLTIHGVKKKVSSQGEVQIARGKIVALADFVVSLKDYDIKVPSLVADKIAESIEVKVNCEYEARQ